MLSEFAPWAGLTRGDKEHGRTGALAGALRAAGHHRRLWPPAHGLSGARNFDRYGELRCSWRRSARNGLAVGRNGSMSDMPILSACSGSAMFQTTACCWRSGHWSLVWATDIGAFFAGRAIGGPKVAPVDQPQQDLGGAEQAACFCRRLCWAGQCMRFAGLDPSVWHWQARCAGIARASRGFLRKLDETAAQGVKDSGHSAAGTWRCTRPARWRRDSRHSGAALLLRDNVGGLVDRVRKSRLDTRRHGFGRDQSTLDLVLRTPDAVRC